MITGSPCYTTASGNATAYSAIAPPQGFARKKCPAGDDVYAGRIARSVAKMEKDEENGMAPEVAGRFLAHVALKKRVKPYYAIGLTYKFFVLLSRILPIRMIGWLLGLLYAGN